MNNLSCIAFLLGAISLVGCHAAGSQNASPASAATPPTVSGDRAQMHTDANSAQATMQSDMASMNGSGNAAGQAAMQMIAIAQLSPAKAATTQPVNNRVGGTVIFTQVGDKVLMVADVTGLEPNSRHVIHLHERGDLAASASSSGSRAIALGNLTADAGGRAHLELTLSDLSVGGMHNDVVGHAVIIRARDYDPASDVTGGGGPRIASGIIELSAAAK
jgi:Cu-Zn family superoxide dismutase